MSNSNYVFHFNNYFMDTPKTYGNIVIYQIGDLQCSPNYNIPRHSNKYFELTLISAGKADCSTNDCTYALEENSLHFSMPTDEHEITADSQNPARYFFVAFELLIIHPLYNDFRSLVNHCSNNNRTTIDHFNLSELFIRCLSEFTNPNKYSNLLIESYLNQILIYSVGNYGKNIYKYQYEHTEHENLVYNIINYIDTNIYSIKNVSEIYRNYFYSESYISHIFTRFMKKTLKRYLADVKLEKALHLIKEGAYSITEIAEKLNYVSIHSFSRSFKDKYLVSPSNFKTITK